MRDGDAQYQKRSGCEYSTDIIQETYALASLKCGMDATIAISSVLLFADKVCHFWRVVHDLA